MRAIRAPVQLVWLAGCVAGCLRIPDAPPPMCQADSDCDRAHGEVCEENVCWGNPPAGTFAAVISPPSTRHDLVSREIPEVALPGDGWMGDLALEAPVLLSGRVLASCPPPATGCEPAPIAAVVTVSRRSQFQGGPGFRAVANVGVGDAFAIPVPRTRPGDDPYTVTIFPDSTQRPGVRSAAELVPPLRTQVPVTDNASAAAFVLGGPALPVISGKLTDSLGRSLAGYRVSALGRWDPAAPAIEVSSIAYTDAQGAYSVTLSDALVGPVELVARPADPASAATVHVSSIDATRSSQHDIVVPLTLGSPVALVVKLEGADSGGTVAPVSGAHVSVTGAQTDALLSFTMSDEQVTDRNGQVTFHLLNGDKIAGSYRLSITPPAGSNLGVMFDEQIPSVVGLQDAVVLPPIRLVPRLALSGRVLGTDGKPLGGVTVTARPSLRFLWSLEPEPQAFVAAIPSASEVTRDDGEFVLWVDPSIPNVAESWGAYDLLFEPLVGSGAPIFRREIAIPRSGPLDAAAAGDITLGDPTLGGPAYIHGRVVGPDGKPVERADFRIYQVSTQLTLCSEVAHAPASCPIPAQLRGRNTSDAEGIVRLILSRP